MVLPSNVCPFDLNYLNYNEIEIKEWTNQSQYQLKKYP